jgi:hypothetical protein
MHVAASQKCYTYGLISMDWPYRTTWTQCVDASDKHFPNPIEYTALSYCLRPHLEQNNNIRILKDRIFLGKYSNGTVWTKKWKSQIPLRFLWNLHSGGKQTWGGLIACFIYLCLQFPILSCVKKKRHFQSFYVVLFPIRIKETWQLNSFYYIIYT